MRCDRCRTLMIESRVTEDAPFPYTMCGLSTVVLYGIIVRVCPQCKAQSPVIPRIADLHMAIAHDLVRKPALLSGEEVRFLRKNAGFPAKEFAALLGLSPEHLSRVENGKTDLGASADRLARALAMDASSKEGVREMLLRLAKQLKEQAKERKKSKRPVFRLVKNRWEAAA